MNTPCDDRSADELHRLICEGLAEHDLPGGQRPLLRQRLLARVGASLAAQVGLLTVRARDGLWRAVKAGVRAKTLWEGPEGNSVLIELAPGASLPVHRHACREEGIVLSGGFQIDGLELGPGDYHMSPAGSRHGRITSRQGVVAYLRGTSLGHTGAMFGELVGGLLPGAGDPPQTVQAGDGGWETLAPGVDSQTLWRDGATLSRFLRLAPGASLPAVARAGAEECMVIAGEAYCGDLLLGAADFLLIPAGAEPGPWTSDGGGLVFLRSQLAGAGR